MCIIIRDIASYPYTPIPVPTPTPAPTPTPRFTDTPEFGAGGSSHCLTLFHEQKEKKFSVRFYYILQNRKRRPERGRFFYIREPSIGKSLRMFHILMNHYSQSKDGVLL